MFNGNNNDFYGTVWRKQFIVKFYDQYYSHIETSQLIFCKKRFNLKRFILWVNVFDRAYIFPKCL